MSELAQIAEDLVSALRSQAAQEGPNIEKIRSRLRAKFQAVISGEPIPTFPEEPRSDWMAKADIGEIRRELERKLCRASGSEQDGVQ
jgi:hypothetical protein